MKKTPEPDPRQVSDVTSPPTAPVGRLLEMETELKFALSPGARRDIEHKVLSGGALPGAAANPEVETDHTVYFDTPDRALQRAGFSLRIRHRVDDGDAYVQTVKTAGRGTFRRREWEWPVAAPHPDLGRLRTVPGLPDLGKGGANLQPVFRTEVVRTKVVVAPPAGGRVELAFDEGAIIADSDSEPVSELELELKAGSEEALSTVALDLLRKAPLTLLSQSKAERGYHLADGTLPAAHEPGAITVEPDLPLQQAFGRLADSLVDQLLANQPATLRGDEEEGIHQMRVAIRRLRSLLTLFDRFLEPHASERFNDELRRLGQVLGEARDWDVFLTEALPHAVERRGGRAWIDPLRRPARERQHAARQAAKKAVLEPAFARFILSFRAWSGGSEGALPPEFKERPMRKDARRLLARVARKVERRLENLDLESENDRHDLRKSLKKLRYSLEYFQGLLGSKGKTYTRRCNKLQKRLGRINDLGNLVRHASELAADQRFDLAPALGILGRRSEALIAKEMKGLPKVLRKFPRQPAFLA